jgi:hypothetical protein
MVAILVAFLVYVTADYAPAFHAGVDEHAYLLAAKSLATQGTFARHLADPYQFTGENMVQTAPLTFYPKTPIGYPLLCAAAYKLGGPSAPFLVNPVMASLALVGIFLLGRALGGNVVGLCAALLLAGNPLHLFYAQQSMAHASDICVATWAIYFAYRWAAHGHWFDAACTGLLLGFDVTVRPTAILILLPMVAMILFRLRKLPLQRGRTAVGCVLLLISAAIGVAPTFVHQAIAFGSPLTSGYSLTGETSAFGLASFIDHFFPMLTDFNVPGFGLFLIFPAALLAMIFWPKLRSLINQRLHISPAPQPPIGWLLSLWVLPILLLYTAYYWYPASNNVPLYLRFFLSVYPPLILLALMMTFALVRARPLYQAVVFLVCVLISLSSVAQKTTYEALLVLNGTCQWSHMVANLVQQNVPEHAVVIADDNSAPFLDYATDDIIYYPRMFRQEWVIRHVSDQVNPRGPYILNPLRAATMSRLLGNQTDEQLSALLRKLLRNHLTSGTEVAIGCNIARAGDWQTLLGPAFKITLIARSPIEWAIYQVQLQPSVAANHPAGY